MYIKKQVKNPPKEKEKSQTMPISSQVTLIANFSTNTTDLNLNYIVARKVGIVSKETGAASVGNLNTINWDNPTN